MAFTHFQWYIFLVVIIGVWLEHGFAAQDICRKFDVGGPCLLLQPSGNSTYRNLEPPSTDSAFCKLACSQGDAELFSEVCPCAAVVTPATVTTFIPTTTSLPTTITTITTTTPLPTTTTTMSTTTPRPVTCYYSSQRPARLNSISRRMFSSTAVTTNCEYPGVVGLFKEENGQLSPVCMASLLEEDTLLINEKNCLQWVQRYTLYVLADSYKAADLTKTVTVIQSSVKKLDSTGSLTSLYTAQLSSKLTFDSGCIQPVCVPNINIPATDIDLNDCRLVGYGDTSDTMFSVSSQLNEIKVTVSASSVTKDNLSVTRVDKKAGMSCLSDDAAPVICSHKTTGEWVTVGITTSVGFPCSQASFTKIVIQSLLREAPKKIYYNAVQKFKFADPNVFTAQTY